jgi:clan AA aspartic protease (TIGR02281 family)
VTYSAAKHYFELYLSEQHDVIANLMSNEEYKLKKYTKDYSLDKKDYSGDYRFEKTVIDDKRFRNEGTINSWTFKTIKYSDIVTEYLIEFNIFSSSSYMLFRSLSQDYYQNEKFEAFNINCYGEDTCVQVRSSAKYFCHTEPNYVPELELNPFYYSTWSRQIQSIEKNKLDTISYPVGENQEIYLIQMYLSKDSQYMPGGRYLKGKFYVRKLHNKISNWKEFKITYDSKSVDKKIAYKRNGNIYSIVIKIGGKPVEYIIDSGASDLVISSSFEKHLISIGTLRDSDYLEPQSYKLADGSLKTYRRVVIPTIGIGTSTVKNVTAIINPQTDPPLLLGKSFLDKMVYWKINNQTGFLEYKLK